MKRSTITQIAGLVIVIAGLAFESLDTKRIIMIVGLVVFWVGVGMERSNNDKN